MRQGPRADWEQAMATLPPVEILEAAGVRGEASRAEREGVAVALQRNESPLEIDTPERARLRLKRLRVEGALFNERVLGADNLVDVAVLEKAAVVARAVCRVRIRNAALRPIGSGSGVMVSPRVVMTNNHVLPSAGHAASSQIEFNFQDGLDGRLTAPVSFGLDPNSLFLTDAKLDFTLVAVREEPGALEPLSSFGWCPLKPEQGKILKGEYVNIVQHPNGGPKKVALRDNRLLVLLEDFLHYETDTEPGSSGSPVFSDQWEMVALHHSAVPAMDEEGRYLTKDGESWDAAMGADRLQWVANEGVRVSRIVHRIQQEPFAGAAAEMIGELLRAEGTSRGSRRDREADSRPPGNREPRASRDGTATWTIPLTVSVTLGCDPNVGPGAPGAPVRPVVRATGRPSLGHKLQVELDGVLRELEASRTREYYDAGADREERDAYYEGLVDAALEERERYRALNRLLTRTHRQELRYRPARYVYPWVDLQPNLKLRSIYSRMEFDPEEMIREDFAIEAARAERLQEVLRTETMLGVDEALSLVEAALPYNCEHVVPQSWFGKKEPMRGDVHHLFACESGCNSFRANIPYWDFPDFEEAERRDCGKRVGKTKFEPSFGKGEAARAVLYFLLRYPGEIDDHETEYERERLAILLRWHEEHPVTEHELHRNAAIFAEQGNRNPLIDFPEWASQIDFRAGLG
jgi:endonuclease G